MPVLLQRISRGVIKMSINSKDDWITAKVIVSRINGGNVKDNSDRYFMQHIASQPDFPKPSRFGRTKVWNWGEVSNYLKRKRECS